MDVGNLSGIMIWARHTGPRCWNVSQYQLLNGKAPSKTHGILGGQLATREGHWALLVRSSVSIRCLELASHQAVSQNVPYIRHGPHTLSIYVQLTCQHFQTLTDFIYSFLVAPTSKAHPDSLSSSISFCTTFSHRSTDTGIDLYLSLFSPS